MKKLLTLLLILAGYISSIASPVDANRAQQLAVKFMKTTSLGQKADIQVNLVYTYATRDVAELYVFNIKGGGFVVVAAEDRVKPILAYATKGSFSSSDIADGFAFQMAGFQEEIQYVREHNIAATPDIVAEWESVATTGHIRAHRNLRDAGPLLETTWNQNYPYNSQCPVDTAGNGGHVYAGCVATAMGQVLKYWDHPVRGTGSHSYLPEDSDSGENNYPVQTANFGHTLYHFELMPLSLDSLSTDEEIFYVAQLLHHLGISVDMMYGPNGSGAYSFSVPSALNDYFNFEYGNQINLNGWWGGYTTEEWINALKDELDLGRPVYYSGSDDGGAGGHAFVCDGYDENDMFHFNWGWSGRDDAYCAIGALNTTKYAFNRSNAAIIGLYPQSNEYYMRPERISNFELIETASCGGVILSWTNPSTDLNGNPLTIDTVYVRRNFETIAALGGVEAGAEMNYTDNVSMPGLYEYAIYARNNSGCGTPVYKKILIGEKCDITFQLHDTGGNGWKGAAISVTDSLLNRIAVITLESGSNETITVPLLRQNLHFIWNHGWYHNNEQYDTDFECSFSVLDAEGNELYASTGAMTDCVFLTHYNDCVHHPECFIPNEITAEYSWSGDSDYGVWLYWTSNHLIDLEHFNIYRGTEPDNMEKVSELWPTCGNHFRFYDNMHNLDGGVYYYQVTAVYSYDDEACESDPGHDADNPENDFIIIEMTSTAEHAAEAKVYPNPTSGLLNIEGQGTMHISVSNLMGQKLLETDAKESATFDMSRYESGIYFISIETENGKIVRKVTVRK